MQRRRLAASNDGVFEVQTQKGGRSSRPPFWLPTLNYFFFAAFFAGFLAAFFAAFLVAILPILPSD
jgi:hypothetical protein